MEIKVIGSGSKGNCYRVRDGKTALLIEAGLPLKKIREGCGFKLSEISGCLITHRHGDHSKSALDLAKNGVDVYSSPDCLDFIGASGFRFHPLKELEPFTLGSFRIVPFPVHHDVPTFGFLIYSAETREKLLFATDCYYIDYVFPRLTHIMVEANYSEDDLDGAVDAGQTPKELKGRLYRSHMSLGHTLALLRANDLLRVKQIYLLHLSENNADAEEFKRAVQAETGCEVCIA